MGGAPVIGRAGVGCVVIALASSLDNEIKNRAITPPITNNILMPAVA